MQELINRFNVRPQSFILLFFLLLPFVFQSGATGQGRRNIRIPDGEKSGLKFRLSERKPESNQPERPQIVAPPAEPISDEAANNLLKRMPPIKSEADDQKEFALRDRSLPAPRTGQTISESFPPKDSVGAPEQT